MQYGWYKAQLIGNLVKANPYFVMLFSFDLTGYQAMGTYESEPAV